MISSLKRNHTNTTQAMFEREDAFISVINPMHKLMNSTTEVEQAAIVAFSAATNCGRYLQPTAEEYAAQVVAEIARKQTEERDKKVKKATPCTLPSGKVYHRAKWEQWEKDCLAKFVEFMTQQEAADSLQRRVNTVRAMSYQLGLKWKYTSAAQKRKALAQESAAKAVETTH